MEVDNLKDSLWQYSATVEGVEPLAWDNSRGGLGGRSGLESGGGRVEYRHRGRRDHAGERVDGCPLHGLDVEYSGGVGALPVAITWPEALMFRLE